MMRNLLLKPINVVARLRGHDAVWASIQAHRLERRLDEFFGSIAESALTARARRRLPAVVDATPALGLSAVDRYWGNHTVRGKTFLSRAASLEYIAELTDGRPLKRELLKLHGPHTDKVILDYGCGPGNDLAGFAEFSGASRIIGVDISRKALESARRRLSWHVRDPSQFAFIRITDGNGSLPFESASIDYIQSLGVIHHASNPGRVLAELSRVLRPDGEMRIMLYNADSLHIQLEIGFVWQIESEQLAGESPEAAFSRTADLGAPVAHCVRPADVQSWLTDTDLHAEFLGGFFVPGEAADWHEKRARALENVRVQGQQRQFLEELSPGSDGLPHYRGLPAGLGAVYVLRKRG